MNQFSSYKRKDTLDALQKEKLDLLVIGGGITGAGISLDATTRGLNTGLIEMQDFAAGTSSRSTKLVHGGLRYLQQFEVKMVAEVGKERAIVYENGPHVTTPEWMLLPFHKGSTLGPLTSNIGLRVYDFLAGVKKDERRVMFKPKEVIEREPLIKQDELRGGGYYVEYKTDDARLTIEVMKKAVEEGVHAINYTKAVNFIYEDSKVVGVIAEDLITGEQHKIYAKKIINAGGPWVDDVRELDGSKKGKTLHLTKGVHLVFDHTTFPLQQAVYFDSPDGRMIFAIPRDGKTYVGTTDTTYEGDIAHPVVTEDDREYLLKAIAYMFPSLQLKPEDVESSWAGLRPLIAQEGATSPSEISRKDEIFQSDSGLLSMAGGKLTGYRKMAQHAVDLVTKQLKEEENILYTDSQTKHLPISGGDVGGSKGFEAYKKDKLKEAVQLGLSEEEALQLIQRYGSNIEIVLDIYKNQKEEANKYNIDHTVFTELVYAIEYELAYKPVDFFIRRTGALFFQRPWVEAHMDKVLPYMKEKLQYTDEQYNEYTTQLKELLYETTHPAK
ncbi:MULTISPECIES: glycerol-3-phosphate dehydrogenase/oxidase [Oceanobacillus]|uniref:Aerobic glycerol-3-phosphate dehydrogenase n=1 Tax=Oceanobacillus kimchii TaxID=746691 RepID=A0ABQ5TJT1_9BACI|nr:MULTISPECIES: glycerol-3-phosphate dehydrogenase/oxidase [Oceanobacillus]MBT2600096.1 glycerol-3-phosphate dehydrogenase/oxidase [Oceanobacillus sp. ISL-74]MBT2650254.1 glycerol-3-phosphate dehydrogenase/oxidase [Oceanobacillus sp. ISL-73]MCT1577997.1 glycerol-3-phosphate dehydrogenase/oxidase [Oceanobacillus kimchii]MCT2137557.1 glycerol-3-phosphate dehydrogenase/oxidase [Oceanobacillus kimchii]GLO67134.1 aerobic glycerol-3-phosphate dehydrogenase [Oceanobacillus kimchii]